MRIIFSISAFVLILAGSTGCPDPMAVRAPLGTWDRYSSDGVDVLDTISFGDDGSYTFDESRPDDPASEDHVAGRYIVRGSTLVVEATEAATGAKSRLTTTIYWNDELFVEAALLPVGEHAGVVGTWKGKLEGQGLDAAGHVTATSGSETTYVLGADGTASITGHPLDGTADVHRTGTYATDGAEGSYVIKYTQDGINVNLHTALVDDAALTGLRYVPHVMQ